MRITIPRSLVDSCGSVPDRVAWLDQLPSLAFRLMRRWSVSVGEPFEASAAWVAPAVREDGTQAVIKINMPHFEAEQEIDGLRVWAGTPTVRLLEADDNVGAMLLERCIPGTALRSVAEPEQDRIIAGLLRRLWRIPTAPNDFRPLSSMVFRWCEETRADAARWLDRALVQDGLQVFEELAAADDHRFLLATDLHAGNVLRAEREPWLVIDPP